MTDHLGDFPEVAALLFKQGEASVRELPATLSVAHAAASETATTLRLVVEKLSGTEGCRMYEAPLSELPVATDNVFKSAKELSKLISLTMTELKKLSESDEAREEFLEKVKARISTDPDAKLTTAQLTAGVATAPSAWRFFCAVPMIVHVELAQGLRDSLLAFLKRKPGTRFDRGEIWNRVVEAAADAAIDGLGIPGGSAMLKIGKAIVDDPIDLDVQRLAAAGDELERVLLLEKALTKIKIKTSSFEDLIKISSAAISESVAYIEQRRTRLEKILRSP